MDSFGESAGALGDAAEFAQDAPGLEVGVGALAGAAEAGVAGWRLHAAARITRGARQVRIRIDHTWKHADAIATTWLRIRAAFT